MSEMRTPLHRPFIEPELRPDVAVQPGATGVTVGSSASTEEIAQVAKQVLLEAGYPAVSPRWNPSQFLDRTLTSSLDIQFTVLDDEAILLNLQNGHYYTLNSVGTVIWGLLDGSRTLREVLNAVCDRFEVDRERAHDDLVALVVRMEREGLLDTERG